MNTGPHVAENTPLLSEQSWAIKPAAQTLRDHSLQSIFIQDICPSFTVEDPRKLGFVLTVLLYLRQNLIDQVHKNKEPYERWSQEQTRKTDIETTEETMKELWDLFLDTPRNTHVIESVVWQAFPLEDQKSKRVRVVDFLVNGTAPQYLSCHPVIVWSLTKVWKRGLTAQERMGWESRYDGCCTPRILHLADVIADFVFLGLVVHLLNNPPVFPQRIAAREVALAILTLTGLCRPRAAHKVSFIISALAFLISIPDYPLRGQTPFLLLTTSMAVHVVELHLARYPSPLYLFPVEWSLPLAVYLGKRLAQGIIPVVLYLFPVFLFSSYLLSTSLADNFSSLQRLAPAPFETRVAFLIFACSVIVTAALCTIILTTLDSYKVVTDRWDRYSSEVGHDARALWFRTIVTYSNPDTFPSPLTFFHTLQFFGTSSQAMKRVRVFVRRLFVGPFALLIYLVCVLLRL
ncbi:hypothetical protein M378DRAFT_155588 [Amanita muscaria Koide BX008]|uniref:Uncharacterized protein n=1 Tax=Amanita muscaria (strain Koide BX008) TaxID=946122 RepID=A0A0C2TTL1_AMAMK|nr:hypothetical protein M378DRAFT_155588 [Amanita muscaria Koide BX008]